MVDNMDDLKNERALSQFANEILFRGTEAVLPQNLPHHWLLEIQVMADEFLNVNFKSKNCKKAGDTADPILSACVFEICKHLRGADVELSKEEFIRFAAIYSVSITMETIRREGSMEMEPPALDNIFSEDRMEDLSAANPDLAGFFTRICIDKR